MCAGLYRHCSDSGPVLKLDSSLTACTHGVHLPAAQPDELCRRGVFEMSTVGTLWVAFEYLPDISCICAQICPPVAHNYAMPASWNTGRNVMVGSFFHLPSSCLSVPACTFDIANLGLCPLHFSAYGLPDMMPPSLSPSRSPFVNWTEADLPAHMVSPFWHTIMEDKDRTRLPVV